MYVHMVIKNLFVVRSTGHGFAFTYSNITFEYKNILSVTLILKLLNNNKKFRRLKSLKGAYAVTIAKKDGVTRFFLRKLMSV